MINNHNMQLYKGQHHAADLGRSRASARPAARRCVVKCAVNVEQLSAARQEVADLIKSKHCNPILVRLAWHDSGTYDKNVTQWPAAGGATASIRFSPEIDHAANAGLKGALDLLEPVKQKYADVSYADLYQMASAIAIEVAGGPSIPMNYGRKDAPSAEACAKPDHGLLPSARQPFSDGSASPGQHLRKIFYRMGLNDQDIVALSGAHTLGRARPDRSGWGKESSKYTEKGPGAPGGQSWTVDWLTFNNSYFSEIKAKKDSELLVLPTDAAVFEDEGFRPYAEQYAADEGVFFKDYVQAHLKLSELGVEWEQGAPVKL